MGKKTGKQKARRRRSQRRKHTAVALFVLVMFAAVLSASALYYLRRIYPHERASGSGSTLHLVIKPELTLRQIGARLERRGVVEHGWLFALYAKARGAETHLRIGTVQLRDDLTPLQVLKRIARGFGPVWVRVTLPEGSTRRKMGEILERWQVCSRKAFLTASSIVRSAEGPVPGEGYLFPDTYEFQVDGDADEVVKKMVDNWHRRMLDTVAKHIRGLKELKTDLNFGLKEVLVLASIVEKESGSRQEMPHIAGVFLNRLRDKNFLPKRLQADPTVLFGCSQHATRACRKASIESNGRAQSRRTITKAMLRDRDNPYNTYVIEGLPPGPICNPGVAAVNAVLRPAVHDFLYFVAKSNRSHAFSKTLSEHISKVERYRSQSK